MIRSTKHTIKFANKQKKFKYFDFLDEYRRVAKLYLDFLWDYVYVWEADDRIYILDIKENFLDVPKYLDKEINDLIQINTPLSARALSSCITQVLGCLKSSLEERRKKLNLLKHLKKENKSTAWLEKKTAKALTKPNLSNINPELSSKCCDLKFINSNEFNAFIQLKSIGKSFGKIRIPIKFYKRSNEWKEKSEIKASFLFSKKNINIRWESTPEKKEEGITVGADQGYKTTTTFSNKMITEQQDLHGHSLESITKKLARQKKGSKAFERTQKHRQNFINWQINHLNFSNIKIVKLEKVVNIRYKRSSSRLMSHWCNPLIRDKILRKCEEFGVQVLQQDSTYRSQRCHHCGLVRKANRKSKEYKCSGCGMICDADLNAAINHEHELPKVPYNLRKLRKNRGKGFYWKPEGFFEVTGEEIRVPLSTNKKV